MDGLWSSLNFWIWIAGFGFVVFGCCLIGFLVAADLLLFGCELGQEIGNSLGMSKFGENLKIC
jgi:hypothetical protein